jgi:hypothetical protein
MKKEKKKKTNIPNIGSDVEKLEPLDVASN